MKSIVLVDSTGKCKIDGQRTQSIKDNDDGLHIISPGSTLSAPGKKKGQLSLAHALALEAVGQLQSTFRKNKMLKVIFINASESVEAKHQKKYDQMTQYREALKLIQTNFTIMDLKSLGGLSYACNVSHYVSFEFQV